MIVAKPIIDKQFWILQENDHKVGNVEACDGGYQVKINNQIEQYKTIKMVEQRVKVRFEPLLRPTKLKATVNLVHGYPAHRRVYNPIWDVQQKLPLFTKTKKSKSWYAAGWYYVKKGRNWSAIQDPKLIMLQRYPYRGPYHTKEETVNHLSHV